MQELQRRFSKPSVIPMVDAAEEAASAAANSIMPPAPKPNVLSVEPESLPRLPEEMPATPPPAPMAMPRAPKPPMPAPQMDIPEAPAAPMTPAPSPTMESVVGPNFDDAARARLHQMIAERGKRGLLGSAFAGFGDVITNSYGKGGQNTMDQTFERAANTDKELKGNFEAGRKAKMEDFATNQALKKSGREEQEYQDQNSPDSQMSKLSVGLAQQMLGADKIKQLGWMPGKTSYADVIKVLPIMEKITAQELARSSKNMMHEEKTGQFNDNKTRQFREEIVGSPAYKGMQTVRGMARSVRMAAKDPSAYGDLSSIYALVKGLDPTSVVREGEIALMREVSGLRDRLVGSLQKWGGKGPLTGQQLKDVETVMSRLEQISRDNVRAQAAPTLNQARRMGLIENEIIPDLGEDMQMNAPAPQASAKPYSDPEKERRYQEWKKSQGTK